MADYRKMWEELGMDLETHDQLCAVLPQAFGDVYLSQENRPETRRRAERYSEPSVSMCRMRSCSRQAASPPGCAADPSSGCPAGKRCFPPIPVR